MARARMGALVDGHFRAEEAGDLEAIVETFRPGRRTRRRRAPGQPAARPGADRGLLPSAVRLAFSRTLRARAALVRRRPRCRRVDPARHRDRPVVRPLGPRTRGASDLPAHLRRPRRADRPRSRLDRPVRNPAAARRLISALPPRPLPRSVAFLGAPWGLRGSGGQCSAQQREQLPAVGGRESAQHFVLDL